MRGLSYAHLSLCFTSTNAFYLFPMNQQKSRHIRLYDGHGPLSEKFTFFLCYSVEVRGSVVSTSSSYSDGPGFKCVFLRPCNWTVFRAFP